MNSINLFAYGLVSADISTAQFESCRCAATGVFLTLPDLYGYPFCFTGDWKAAIWIYSVLCMYFVSHIQVGMQVYLCISAAFKPWGPPKFHIVFHPRDVKHVYTLTLASIMDNREVHAPRSPATGLALVSAPVSFGWLIRT